MAFTYKNNPQTGKPDRVGVDDAILNGKEDVANKTTSAASLSNSATKYVAERAMQEHVADNRSEMLPLNKMKRYGTVLHPSASGFDSTDVAIGDVFKLGSTYYMIYNGNNAAVASPRTFSIGIATSTDKITWEKQGQIVPIPADLIGIFATCIYQEGGTLYMFAAGFKTTAGADPEIVDYKCYTALDSADLTDPASWTDEGTIRRNTDIDVPPVAGNDSVIDGGDGYYYMTISRIDDYVGAVENEKIQLLRSATLLSEWTAIWDGVEHIVIDPDETRWNGAFGHTAFDSKIFKAGAFWVIYAGSTGWAGGDLPNFNRSAGRYFFSRDIEGPYNTLPDPLYRVDGLIVGNTAGRSAHIIEDEIIDTFIDARFIADGKVKIMRFTNQIDENIININTDDYSNSNAQLTNVSVFDNYAILGNYPSNGENVGMGINIVPKGTGYNSNLKTQISVFSTDFVADSANYEALTLQAGSTRYTLKANAVGTGTVKPISFLAGATTALTVTPNAGVQVGAYTQGTTTDPGAGNLVVDGDVTATAYHGDGSALTGISTQFNIGFTRNISLTGQVDYLDGLDTSVIVTDKDFANSLVLDTTPTNPYKTNQAIGIVNNSGQAFLLFTDGTTLDGSAVDDTIAIGEKRIITRNGDSNDWITIMKSGSGTTVVDNLSSTSSTSALSAGQGKVLSDRIPLITASTVPRMNSGATAYEASQITSTTTGVGIGVTPAGSLHIADTGTATTRGFTVQQSNNANSAPFLTMRKSKGSVASPTATASGNNLGSIFFQAYVGATNTWQYGASIQGVTTGAASDAAYGPATDLRFFTADGTAALAERLRITSAGYQAVPMGGAVASASTIAPTGVVFHVTGTTTINTITAPTLPTTSACQITIIPDGIFTTGVIGNIAMASTAVVSKALIMVYDVALSKWYPSY